MISLFQVTPTRSTGGASYIHHEEDGFSTATEVHIILDGLFKRQKSIPILFYKVLKFFCLKLKTTERNNFFFLGKLHICLRVLMPEI